MLNKRIQEEQQYVDQTIQQIEEIIEEIEESRQFSTDYVKQYEDSRKAEKLVDYERALAEPYIGSWS